MASNEPANGETLFPGWSSVVHQPLDDVEESDLPSTVDITAFSSQLSGNIVSTDDAQIAEQSETEESDDEDGSSNSGSANSNDSQSESTETEESSSSESGDESSRSPSPDGVPPSSSSILRPPSVLVAKSNGLRVPTAPIVIKEEPANDEQENSQDCISISAPIDYSSNCVSLSLSKNRNAAKVTDPTKSGGRSSSSSSAPSSRCEEIDRKERLHTHVKPVTLASATSKIVVKESEKGKNNNVSNLLTTPKLRIRNVTTDKTRNDIIDDGGNTATRITRNSGGSGVRRRQQSGANSCSSGNSAPPPNPRQNVVSRRKRRVGKSRKRKSNNSKKMSAALPISRGSTYTTSDSDDSDSDSAMLASCSLQEIRQEDLAAILPDEQECDEFGDDFVCRTNNSSSGITGDSSEQLTVKTESVTIKDQPQSDTTSAGGGDLSGSDIELSQQAVNAIIERATDSSSDTEVKPVPNAQNLQVNSLLQQFVAQTQMLNTTPCNSSVTPNPSTENSPTIENTSDTKMIPGSAKDDSTNCCNTVSKHSPNSKFCNGQRGRRRRGRPRKTCVKHLVTERSDSVSQNNPREYRSIMSGDPNVSPDSGIQNSPIHVVSSPEPVQVQLKKGAKRGTPSQSSVLGNKLETISRTDDDRVLYPFDRQSVQPTTDQNHEKHWSAQSNIIERSEDIEKIAKSEPIMLSKTSRPVLATKNNKSETKNVKYTALKQVNVLHSKHKHKKHKKCKIKILKPASCNMKHVDERDLEQLVNEFSKFCVVGMVQQHSEEKPKENIPQDPNTANDFSKLGQTKKVGNKKRKTATEHYGERKKKKINTSTIINKSTNINNEQRVLPLKKRHYLYPDSKTNAVVSTDKEEELILKTSISEEQKTSLKHLPEKAVTTPPQSTTPKKRPRVDDSIIVEQQRVVKTEITEDSADSVAENILPIVDIVSTSKFKIKGALEGLVNELKMKRSLSSTPTESIAVVEQQAVVLINNAAVGETHVSKVQQKQNTLDLNGKKRIRKRRAINRTGFPTVKKKKKVLEKLKVSDDTIDSGVALKREKSVDIEITEDRGAIVMSNDRKPIVYCDRVPIDGEEYNKFIQRTENGLETHTNSLLAPEESQLLSTKWEMMSECESLPLDERIADGYTDSMSMDLLCEEYNNASDDNCENIDGDALSLEDSVARVTRSTKAAALSKKRKKGRERRSKVSAANKINNSKSLSQCNNGASNLIPSLRKVTRNSLVDGDRKSLLQAIAREERASPLSSDDTLYVDSKKGNKKMLKLRKKYLVAGLFSDYYKEDDISKLIKRHENAVKSRFTYIPSEHPFGLMPPPIHCGKYLRNRKAHFLLPYDIWWQHQHSQLPSRETVASWNYRKLRTNFYNVGGSAANGSGSSSGSGSKSSSYNYQYSSNNGANSCNCTLSANNAGGQQMRCGDDCLNRLVLTECSPNNNHKCLNQRIQRHDWAPGLEKFMTQSKGWGIRTKLPIKRGDFILEYLGEVVSDSEFKKRMQTIYLNDQHHYCLHLEAGLLIDGHRMGSEGRFVNHSCEPNCEMQKWLVNGQHRMTLYALRDIEADEELTYDYNFFLFNPAEGQECKCGSAHCRGVIGGKSQRLRAIEGVANSSRPSPSPGQSVSSTSNSSGNQDGCILRSSSALCRHGRPRKLQANKRSSKSKESSTTTGSEKPNVDGRVSKNAQPVDIVQDSSISVPQYMSNCAVHLVATNITGNTSWKPLSHQQKCFVLEHRCFLVRNLIRITKLKNLSKVTTASTSNLPISHRSNGGNTCELSNTIAASANNTYHNIGLNGSIANNATRQNTSTPTNFSQGATFLNHLNAFEKPRTMKTRRLAQADANPELNKTVKLASVLKDILTAVLKAKDENGELLSAPFVTLPSKRKVPEFHQTLKDGLIDLNTVEQNIANGIYLSADNFHVDMNRLFNNYIKFFGRSHEWGAAALKLRKLYAEIRQQNMEKLENINGGTAPSPQVSSRVKKEEEDIIRCICGMPRDEGLMIQCESCMVWQHSECVKADINAASYHCEICVPRHVDYEIPLDEFTEHGHRYYLTLLRGDLQLRQGDTVYVLRDIPIPNSNKKHTYDTIGKVDYSDLDIFRIERLWKDSKTGQRFAYGHHYLRPHETYHEPSRRFFSNEVMRVPLYEAVPVELVIEHCWVMDINTYCKGRPIGASEEHTYICEYRVDKYAKLFFKVSKSTFPICTKSFAFQRFENRLKISRSYTPHDVDPALLKPRKRKQRSDSTGGSSTASVQPVTVKTEDAKTTLHVNLRSTKSAAELEYQSEVDVKSMTTTNSNVILKRKTRLNKIMLHLLHKLPTKQIMDVSYLLDEGRRRTRTQGQQQLQLAQ